MNAESDALLTSFDIICNFEIMVGFLVQTFFITQKSLGGHTKTSVTSTFLKIIKFHVVDNLEESTQNVKTFKPLLVFIIFT